MKKIDELKDPKSCLNKAKDDEWLFVLLGRDPSAVRTVRFWIQDRILTGQNDRNDPKLIEAEQWAATVEKEFLAKMVPAIYRVTVGNDKGALVRLCFVNARGMGDCVYAEPYQKMAAGEVVVVRLENLRHVATLEEWDTRSKS